MGKKESKAGTRLTEAIFMWDLGGLSVAIPKRRGAGYLKVPYGHHAVPGLSAIENSENVDMCGLDGYIEMDYGYVYPQAKRDEIVARVLPKLAKHFDFLTWREDEKQFWKIVLPMNTAITEAEALDVLREVRAKLGRTYKAGIREAWMTGNYAGQRLAEWDSKLQRIRNVFGPTWLVRARP